MGSVVPYTDNFFATLNSAVFTDGSFCYIPEGSPLALLNCLPISGSMPPIPGSLNVTLLIADEGAYVSYMEGCTAPQRDENSFMPLLWRSLH